MPVLEPGCIYRRVSGEEEKQWLVTCVRCSNFVGPYGSYEEAAEVRWRWCPKCGDIVDRIFQEIAREFRL